ncbi:MAG: hypothetical protein GXP24_14035 [Planctomycetes bacterium]|nr:hypothetical protein [Planctomycetota bacterium]
MPIRTSAPNVPQIECGSCQQKLPLRLTTHNEPAAVWLCAKCNVPFVACCVREALLKNAQLIRLDERFFDVSGQPDISLSARQQAIKLASRPVNASHLDKRRSERVVQSLVVPAVKLVDGFVPVEEPFQLMVANLSREGIGLIHSEPIDSDYLVIEFSPKSKSPIQVIVHLVRQRELTPPYYELGGEFMVRLGSIATH